MTYEKYLKSILAVAFGAVCISFAPVFVKMLGEGIVGPTAIGFWRTFLGAIVLFTWAGLRGDSLKIPWPVMKFALLGGLFFYGDLFVWHRSIIYAGAGLSTILGNTQVYWMAFIGVVLFKEKLKPTYLIAVCTAFVGVILLVGVGSIDEFSTTYIKGIIYGLMTGFFYSSFMISLKKAGHNYDRLSFIPVMAWASFYTAVFTGISSLIESDPIIPPDLYSWMTLIGLAVVVQALGWWIISSNLSKLKASQSGMILLLQPTLATVWGYLFFDENLKFLQIVGAVLTITAIYFGTVRLKNKS